MATVKPVQKQPESLPEQIDLAVAHEHLESAQTAQREAMATLQRLQATLGPAAQHTASQVIEENIRQVPGTRIGKLFGKGHPPVQPVTVSRADVARAKLALPTAQEALIVSEADLLDARMALDTARRALNIRQLRDALPVMTAEVDRLLTKAESLAAEAAAFTTERLLPLLEACPLAGALSECRLTELEILRDRTPRIRALLAALQAQYIPTNGGS